MGLNTSVLGMEVRSSAFSWLSFLECIQSAVTLTMSCERWVSWSAGGWAPLASGAGASMQLHTLHSYCLLTCNNHTESVEEWRKGDKHSPSQASRIHGLKYFKLKQKFLAKFWHKTVLDKIVWRGWRWSSLKYLARRLTLTRPDNNKICTIFLQFCKSEVRGMAGGAGGGWSLKCNFVTNIETNSGTADYSSSSELAGAQ